MIVTVVLGVVLAVQAHDGEGLEALGVGSARAVRLGGAGAEHVFRVPSTHDGPCSVWAESFDFAPRLRAIVDGEERLGQRVGTGAWLSLEAAVAPDGQTEIEIRVDCPDGSGGDVLLQCQAGVVAPPQEPETVALARVYGALMACERASGVPQQVHRLQHRLGEELFRRAEFSEAARAFDAAFTLARQQGNARGQLAACGFLGAVVRRIGPSDGLKAEQMLSQALAQRELLGPAFECFLLQNLGDLHIARREYALARTCFESWRDVAQREGLLAFEALAWNSLATAHRAAADAAAAAEAQARALDLLDDFEAPYIASQVLLGAGRYHESRDRHEAARELLERAQALPTTWEVELEIAVELGQVNVHLGRYGPARSCLERARRLGEGRSDARYDLGLWHALVLLEYHTGNLHGALTLAEQALRTATVRGDRAWEAAFLGTLGMFREQLGETLVAIECYERARALCTEITQPELEWKLLNDGGRLLRSLGRPAEGLELHRRALAMRDRVAEPMAHSASLNGMACCLLSLGGLAEARRHVEQAVELLAGTSQPDALLAGPLHTLAKVLLAQGELDEVEGLLLRADELIERDNLLALPAGEAAGVRSGFALWGEIAQDLVALRLEQPEQDAAHWIAWGFGQAGRWKGRALLEGLGHPADDAATPEALRPVLAQERVLLEYVNGSDDLHAYVLDAQGLSFRRLAPRQDVDAAVQLFVSGINDRSRLAPVDDVGRLGSRLHELLLAPLLAERNAKGLVIVPTPALAGLPFEALVTSVVGDPTTFAELDFVADRFEVSYAPSTPVLARLQARGPLAAPGRALVLGDPLYARELAPHSGASLRTPAGELARLPGTRSEALELARSLLSSEEGASAERESLLALEQVRSGALHAQRFDLFLGEDARSERLQGDLRGYSLLHLAAHGEADARDPLAACLVLSAGGGSHGFVSTADIAGLRLDAELVTLSACDTARGRVLPGEGVQSMATAFLQAGSRGVVASLWSVDDVTARDTMGGFYAGLLRDGRSPALALLAAKRSVAAETTGSVETDVERGQRIRPAPSGEQPVDRRHPYYWAPFVYMGAIR